MVLKESEKALSLHPGRKLLLLKGKYSPFTQPMRWKPNWILEKHKTPRLYKIYDTMQVLVTHLRQKSRVVKKERVTF